MSSIDNRIVEMKFDNAQFNTGVQSSMSILDRLKQALKLDGASTGLEQVSKTANSINLNGLQGAVDTIQSRFSTLGQVGAGSLQQIGSVAVSVGAQLAKSITVQPLIDGMHEYETQLNSVQTILANTQSKGTNIKQVNSALDELNTYADKTIYNFSEMTRNVGTFTAAGVDLDKSVASIKGISNLAAMSGSSATQASTAMYQLSQAIAAGRVQLMDWNSVVNAGMGGEAFQNALKRTATHFGTDVDGMIEKYGSFRESLTRGQWLTSDVLTETLKQLSGAYTEADLVQQGYTEQQAKDIVSMASTAEDAATKVKTFSQLIDTTKEALGSGWAQTWRTVFGDFEEARELWTSVNDVVSGFINKQSDARNAMVSTWKEMGGRDTMLKGLSQAFENVSSVVGKISDAFHDVFPPMTAQTLVDITNGFADLMEKLKPSEKLLSQIGRISKGVFSGIQLIGKGVSALLKPIGSFLGSDGFGSFLDMLVEGVAKIGDFITKLNESKSVTDVLSTISDALSGAFSGIGDILGGVTDKLDGFSGIADIIGNAFGKVKDVAKDVFSFLTENISGGDILAGLAGGGIFIIAKKLGGAFDQVKETLENLPFIGTGGKGGKGDENAEPGFIDTLKTSLSGFFDELGNSLKAFTGAVQVGSLVAIAAAIAILTSSVKTLSQIDPVATVGSLTAIGAMLLMLTGSFKSLSKALEKFKPSGVVKAGIALMAMAVALKIFASAIKDLSKLDLGQVATGLIGLGGGLAMMVGALKVLDKAKVKTSTSLGMIALAAAAKILASALKDFSSMNWDEIARGLTGMGVALGEMTAALAILSKVGGGGALLGGAAILVVALSLKPIGDALIQIKDLSWEQIAKGLVGLGGALTELAVVSGILGQFPTAIVGAAAVLLTAQALKPIGDALIQIKDLSWEQIAIGLAGIGGALTELAVVSGILGTFPQGLISAAAVLLTAQALKPIGEALQEVGDLSWEQIAKGLVGLGGALTELAVVSGILGTFPQGLIGAAALVVGVQSLGQLADALKKFGEMSWDQIGQGLTAMGGALATLAGGTILNSLGILGGISVGLVTDNLDQLYNAVKKFSEIDAASLQTGISAMTQALGATGLGGLLNTFSGFGAGAIATVAEPLGTLADSVKKWSGVTVPEGLGAQIGSLASGIMSFTFGGLGAGTLSTVAGPLGTLADSVKKWSGVTVPEGLGAQLSSLASGINAFSFSFMGGFSIGTVAGPLGQLADSISKWNTVTIPEGLGGKLKSLANGINAFSLSFMAGFSIGTITDPMGQLAEAVGKWNSVTIPEGIGGKLESLASGINSFSLSFVAGFSIGTITGPMNDLASAVKKWNSVSIPDGIGSSLKGLANGLKNFSGLNIGDMSSVASATKSIASAAKNLNGVNFGSMANGLKSFSSALQSMPKSIPNIAGQITALASSMRGAGANLSSGLASGIQSGMGRVTSTCRNMVNQAANAIRSGQSSFRSAGTLLMNAMANGMNSGRSRAVSIARQTVSQCRSAVSGQSGALYSAGLMLMSGLARGISAGRSSAVNAAASAARAAVSAARAAAGVHSPSTEFAYIGRMSMLGLAQGLSKNAVIARNSVTRSMGAILTSANDLASEIDQSFNRDIHPTITPVVDMSYVDSATNTIESKISNLRLETGIALSEINAAYSSRQQAQATNTDVVNAINKLRTDISNMPRNTTNVGGVTYSDGTAVSNAVNDLVRAIRVEGRS